MGQGRRWKSDQGPNRANPADRTDKRHVPSHGRLHGTAYSRLRPSPTNQRHPAERRSLEQAQAAGKSVDRRQRPCRERA